MMERRRILREVQPETALGVCGLDLYEKMPSEPIHTREQLGCFGGDGKYMRRIWAPRNHSRSSFQYGLVDALYAYDGEPGVCLVGVVLVVVAQHITVEYFCSFRCKLLETRGEYPHLFTMIVSHV